MLIGADACVGCEICVPYCPVGAIEMDGEIAVIDLDQCVECGVCKRVGRCPTDAFYLQPLEWPRTVRHVFSDPVTEHAETRIAGRGTEEIKTNEVTHRIGADEAGINIEFGRPGVSTRLGEVETVAHEIADLVTFEPENPLTSLMADPATGELREDVVEERVMSAILEFTVDLDELAGLLDRIASVLPELESVASLNAGVRIEAGERLDETRLGEVVAGTPFSLSVNGKTNIGIGRPDLADPAVSGDD